MKLIKLLHIKRARAKDERRFLTKRIDSTSRGQQIGMGIIAILVGALYSAWVWPSQEQAASSIDIIKYFIQTQSVILAFSTMFILAGLSLLIQPKYTEARPTDPQIFSPNEISRAFFRQLLESLPTILFIICFAYGFATGMRGIGLFIGAFLLLLIIGALLYALIGAIQLQLQAKKYGISKLQVLSPMLGLGDKAVLQFQNKNLYKSIQEVDVYLWNIAEESIPSNRNRNRNRLQTVFLHEEQQRFRLNKGSLEIQFQIPYEGVLRTDFDRTPPTYWEVEVSRHDLGFYSYFHIEIS